MTRSLTSLSHNRMGFSLQQSGQRKN